MTRPIKLAYLVSHPIQYQAPLLRRLQQEPGLELTTFFLSDFSVRGYRDAGFGVEVAWDVPLLEGYRHAFLKPKRDSSNPGFWAPYPQTLAPILDGGFDALWVHGYAHAACLAAIWQAKARGMKVLLRGDSTLLSHPRSRARRLAKQLLLRTLFSRIDAFLATGSLNAAYYRHYGVDEQRVFLMPYAVDNQRFQQACEASSQGAVGTLKAAWGLPTGRPVILSAAKFMPRKRTRDLWLAYKQLSVDGVQEPHPLLVLAGDGEQRAAIEAEVRATGWRSVFFPGFINQSQMPALYGLGDVFVLPSEHEPWGLAVNEAMNAARPVVLSDQVGAGPDLVRAGHTGLIFPVGHVTALADALRQILDPPGRAEEMGQKALARISEWDFEANAQGLMQALSAIVRIAP